MCETDDVHCGPNVGKWMSLLLVGILLGTGSQRREEVKTSKFKMCLSFDSVIPFVGMQPKKIFLGV